MPSSITNPSATAKAPSVMMLSVWPNTFISAKVIVTVSGSAIKTTLAVRRLPRNNTTTSIASTPPMTMASITLFCDSWTICDWS